MFSLLKQFHWRWFCALLLHTLFLPNIVANLLCRSWFTVVQVLAVCSFVLCDRKCFCFYRLVLLFLSTSPLHSVRHIHFPWDLKQGKFYLYSLKISWNNKCAWRLFGRLICRHSEENNDWWRHFAHHSSYHCAVYLNPPPHVTSLTGTAVESHSGSAFY